MWLNNTLTSRILFFTGETVDSYVVQEVSNSKILIENTRPLDSFRSVVGFLETPSGSKFSGKKLEKLVGILLNY